MRLAAYLADRAAGVVVRLATLAFAGLVLVVYGVDPGVVAFVGAVLVLAEAVVLMVGYLRRRDFYDELLGTEEALGREAYLASELVERPRSLEQRLFYDAVDAASQAMRDEVASVRRSQTEYRDYVETWVHEIKTPIAAARLTAHNNAGVAWDHVDDELDQIEGYVEQALYYARSTSLERDYSIGEVCLADVVRAALKARARTLIGARVTPVLGEGLELTVRADSKWLGFVLGQLLVNAAKYRAPGEGPATVRIWAERRDAGLGAATTTLHVADDGIGIPADDLPRVFDRGFTGQNGRRYAKSTGMGLYLVKELCGQMGLAVGATSEPGAGSDFTIAFPA